MNKKFLPVLILALVLFVAALLVPATLSGPAQAAPPAAPTPVANLVYSADGNYFTFMADKAWTADGYSDPVTLASFEWADWQYLIDQSALNTTTVTIQHSNDGENWVDATAVISANEADAGDITRLPLFGRYTRLKVDVSTTDTIRLTVNLLAK